MVNWSATCDPLTLFKSLPPPSPWNIISRFVCYLFHQHSDVQTQTLQILSGILMRSSVVKKKKAILQERVFLVSCDIQ